MVQNGIFPFTVVEFCGRWIVYNCRLFAGSCLLWVMSTDISVDIAVDIAVDTRSIVGRHLVDSRSILGRHSVDIAVDSRQ